MKESLLLLFKYGAFALIGGLALVLAAILLISAVLIVLLMLQAAGITRRVPLGYNFRNLVVRWRTTLLTVLAFVLVVAVITVMRAFVNGMYALTQSSATPGNVLVLGEGATDEVFSDLGYGDISLLSTRDCVKKAIIQIGSRQEEAPLVSWELYQVVNQPVPNATAGRLRRFVQIRGVEDPVISGLVHELALHDGGHWFDVGAGVQGGTDGDSEQYVQGVLGEGIARELGGDLGKHTLLPGDKFELGPRKWIVVGIMKSGGKTFDSEVWAKRKVVGEMLRKDTRSTAVLRVKDGLDAEDVAKDLTTQFKSPAIQARTEADYYESLNTTNAQFLWMIRGLALFVGVGGVFGIMNTMFAAIAQRTRDIGVLRILGFARWQILGSFFLESLLIALLGGLIGCALASLANGLSATSQIGSGMGGGKTVILKIIVDARVLGEGLAFSVLMGCVGGLPPALSAVRLKVLDALR